MGIGPLWYAHVLFVASLLIVLIRKIDKNDKLSELGRKIKLWMLIPLGFAVWGSSFILIVPMISVYRFGIYLFLFLLGYYIFSNEIVQDKLQEYSIVLISLAGIIGVLYVIKFYSQNYTTNSVLQNWFTNIYLWFSIIVILTFGKKYLNFSNKITEYMTKNNFSFYVLHYQIIILLGYVVVNYFKLPFLMNYIIILLGTIIILPITSEILKRIPVINKLLLGVNK